MDGSALNWCSPAWGWEPEPTSQMGREPGGPAARTSELPRGFGELPPLPFQSPNWARKGRHPRSNVSHVHSTESSPWDRAAGGRDQGGSAVHPKDVSLS